MIRLIELPKFRSPLPVVLVGMVASFPVQQGQPAIRVPPEQLRTPAQEAADAAGDAARLPPDVASHTRYLTLYDVPRELRSMYFAGVSHVLNSVSRSRAVYIPQRVTATLLRIDTRWFAPDPVETDSWETAWANLSDGEYAFRLRTEVFLNGKRQTVTVDGGWVLNAGSRLKAYTGSRGAIMRADYFIATASKPPHYYDLSGVPATEAEFLKSLGADLKTIEKLRGNLGANKRKSEITRKSRRFEWDQGVLGGIYRTYDVAIVDAAHDPIRRAITAPGLAFQYEAGEWFAVQPNGYFRVALYAADGKRQDAVPAAIATDDRAVEQGAPDTQVVPMVSCYRCHVESGLRPFRDDQTGIFASHEIDLRSYDPLYVQRAKEFYQEPRLQRQMAFDRQTFDAAVMSATGWTSAVAAERFSEMVQAYVINDFTIEQARRELGHDLSRGCHDPNSLALLKGETTTRDLWKDAFAEGATLGPVP